jgi:glycerophosphoryl diester phosphodiesterase
VTVLAVAHRAGNSLTALQVAAEVGADVVECDVHASRGRLEVRHSKALGPWLWDRGPWELTSRAAPQLELAALLEATDAALMLDLKGVGPVGRRTAHVLRRQPRPVLVCSRWWPSVDAFAELDGVRPVLSARSRADLARLRRRVRARPPHGVSLHGSLLSAPVVAELRERVELVMTWGVDDLDALDRVTGMGVNAVISNSADVLRAVRSHR